jgi:hypothetical protein
MSRRDLRKILAGIMLLTLFLPMDPEVGPNLLGIFWYSLELLATVSGQSNFDELVFVSGALLYFYAVPILILLNVCSLVFPIRGLEALYRISLLILCPLIWWFVIFILPPFRGIGHWANPVVVSAAALLEIAFLVRESMRRSESSNQEAV